MKFRFPELQLVYSLLALLVLSITAGDAHALEIKPGNFQGSVRVNGQKRTFRYHVPKGFGTSQRLPLVIVLHGAVGSGWSGAWDSRMSKQADKDHFVVAYPNGIWRTWNAGDCCSPARKLHIDDIAFMREMIERFKSELPIDGDRVCVSGISNGGMLAYRIGLELADEVAAIAPIEGCMYTSKQNSDSPISVVAVHGTKDRIIQYNGGSRIVLPGYKVTAQSVADTMQYWVKHNHCEQTPIHTQTGKIEKDLYTGGRDGTEVCLYTVNGGGHVWPGGRRCVFVGDRPNKEFSATEAIAEFFLSHPKHQVTASIRR